MQGHQKTRPETAVSASCHLLPTRCFTMQFHNTIPLFFSLHVESIACCGNAFYMQAEKRGIVLWILHCKATIKSAASDMRLKLLSLALSLDGLASCPLSVYSNISLQTYTIALKCLFFSVSLTWDFVLGKRAPLPISNWYVE